MFKSVLDDHLKRIESKVDDKPSIIVYKGFPPYLLKKVANAFNSWELIEQFYNDDLLLDLEKIENTLQKTLSDLLSYNKDVVVLPYEVVYRLSSIFDLSFLQRKIVIIENTLFQNFPKLSNVSIQDIENELDTSEPTGDQKLFDKFYANSLVQHGLELVEYADLPESLEEIEKFTFADPFRKGNQEIKYVNEGDLKKDKYIVFNSSDASYDHFINDLFWDKHKGDAYLVIDEFPTEGSIELNEIGTLLYLFKHSSFDLSIFAVEKKKKEYFRPDFINILQEHWKSSEFREIKFYKNPAAGLDTHEISQGSIIEEIITQAESAIQGEIYKDIFLTAPTGSGKSILFQIPAIYLAEQFERVTLVISPLKALMRDQVSDLNTRGVHNAAYINSDISLVERNEIIESIKEGEISILYLSPELLLSYHVEHFIGDREIGLMVVDEAHLVTTWGRDFRVDYWFLGNYIKRLRKYYNSFFPVVAVTATAVYDGPDDLVFETVESLNMQMRELYIGDIRREDIKFKISQVKYNGSYEDQRNEKTVNKIKSYIDKGIKAIIYFPWTNQIEETILSLPEEYRAKVDKYYGQVSKEIRNRVLKGFKENNLKVVLATKAFGMGVDISDIEEVYHHAPSGNLSDYVQEVGRVARRSDITGIVRVNFSEKDLKYTKILYGLSAIRQYHVIRILQKLNKIYKIKKSRNFLVSVDDFRFVFSEEMNESSVEQKVKSSLLLLERDLLAKSRFNVIIVRPKTLFSTVFIRVKKKVAPEFLKKYGEYSTQVDTNQQVKKIKIKNGFRKIKPNPDPVFMFRLNELWENEYSKESFPKIKHDFFEGELFKGFEEKVHPQYRLRITLNITPKETNVRMKEIFSSVENALIQLGTGFFSKNDLSSALKEKIGNRTQREKISDLLTAIFSTHKTLPGKRGGRYLADKFCFLQKKREGHTFKYRIFRNNFLNIKDQLVRQFLKMFYGSDQLYEGFISIDPKKSKLYHDLAYILESFDLGTYELDGGQTPQLFIRINDPNKISYLANSNYSNEIVRDIENRHENSVEIMKKFFLSDLNNNERWDFIERYFIGYDLNEIMTTQEIE